MFAIKGSTDVLIVYKEKKYSGKQVFNQLFSVSVGRVITISRTIIFFF